MANRYFYEFLQMFEKRPVVLWGKVAIGATGAPTVDATQSRGIKSVVRTGAGAYTITLEDQYQKLLMAQQAFITSTGTDAALEMTVTADGVASATPIITVVFRVAAGTATDPSNGSTLLLQLMLRNSSSPV